MNILGTKWFCGRANIGIVRVQTDYDRIVYYIGSPRQSRTAEQDAAFIADWGSTFPVDAGDKLFGITA